MFGLRVSNASRRFDVGGENPLPALPGDVRGESVRSRRADSRFAPGTGQACDATIGIRAVFSTSASFDRSGTTWASAVAVAEMITLKRKSPD
jgi:hypothetical protein